jgi:basic amino acid/polyamine antiporter, APA family
MASPSHGDPHQRTPDGAGLLRALGLTTAVAMVIGNVIGTGIFVMPGQIAAELGQFWLIATVWVLGGISCIFGGLALAELAAMMPQAGGLYVYLREAYGPPVAFLFGWNELLFNRPASTGAVAIVLARSLARIGGWQLSNLGEVALAIVVVLVLAAINIRGVIWGGAVQVTTTAVKVSFLLFMIALPLALWMVSRGTFSFHNWATTAPIDSTASLATRLGVAALAVMWAYNGWHAVTPVAEEIRNAERNVPLALFGGIGAIMALYLGATMAYHGVFSMTGVIGTGEHTAEEMLALLLGPAGAVAMSTVLLVGTFGTINGDFLIAPRISFAMARDGVFFHQLARIHPQFRTPALAIGVQAGMAILLVLASGLLVEFYAGFERDSAFQMLINFVIFAASIFYALGTLAVIVLRWRQPDRPRPYRTWGYPFVPLAFLTVYAWFLAQVYIGRPFEARAGLLLIAAGLPFYLAFAAAKRRRARISIPTDTAAITPRDG